MLDQNVVQSTRRRSFKFSFDRSTNPEYENDMMPAIAVKLEDLDYRMAAPKRLRWGR